MNFDGDVSGSFDSAEGLFGLNNDVYFDIEQSDAQLKLVARDFLPGLDGAFSALNGADASGVQNDIGRYLNVDYFTALDLPDTLEFSAGFDAGFMSLSGDFFLQYSDVDQNFALSLDGDLRVGDNLSISGAFGLQRDEAGDRLLLVSDAATAVMSAGDYAVGLAGARFGLVSGPDGLALEASGGLFANLGSQLVLAADGASLYYNSTGSDWAGISISAGAASYTFDSLLASDRQGVAVTGAALQVSDFIRAEGSFAITSGEETLTLADGQALTADVLTFGGRGLSGFVGLNGGSDARTGLALTHLDLGLALLSDQAATGFTWLALQGLAGGVSLEGLPTDIVISADQLKLEINDASSGAALIDFKTTPLAIATGGDDMVLVFDAAAGSLLRAAGDLNLALAGFFSVSGSFAFERSSADVRLSDGSNRAVDLMTLGAENVTAFAGVNGQTADALGLALDDLSFGLALIADANNAAQKWLALQGNAASVSFVGVDDFALSGQNLGLAINRNASTQAEPVAQEDELMATELLLGTSSVTGSLTLDFLGEAALVGLVKGRSDSNVRNKLARASEELLKAAAAAHGGYRVEDVSGQVLVRGNAADGFSLTFSGALAGIDFSALGATAAEGAAPVLTVEQVGQRVARADLVANLDANLVVDFSASALAVATGANSAIVLDMAGRRGDVLEAVGTLSIDVAGFVGLSGRIGFSSETRGTDHYLVAAGGDVSARLAAGDAAYVEMQGAAFGLLSNSAG